MIYMEHTLAYMANSGLIKKVEEIISKSTIKKLEDGTRYYILP